MQQTNSKSHNYNLTPLLIKLFYFFVLIIKYEILQQFKSMTTFTRHSVLNTYQ